MKSLNCKFRSKVRSFVRLFVLLFCALGYDKAKRNLFVWNLILSILAIPSQKHESENIILIAFKLLQCKEQRKPSWRIILRVGRGEHALQTNRPLLIWFIVLTQFKWMHCIWGKWKMKMHVVSIYTKQTMKSKAQHKPDEGKGKRHEWVRERASTLKCNLL